MILPPDFVNHLKQHITHADKVLDALTQPSNTSIRLNVSKTKNAFDLQHLEPIAWAQDGYYLSQRPLFTVDPFFQSGYYYVQEAGSMFIGEIIKQLGLNKSTVCGLDLCAAPGGKSTHILSMLQPESVLVSNEIIKTRTPILIDNLIKWGLPNFIVTQSDARQFGLLPALFDFILCDAPCSGEGMLRKSNDALQHWSLNNVNLCAQRQQRIVHDVWPSLKCGGYFIYATCTFNVVENEENIASFTETLPASSIKLQTHNGIVESITKNKNGHLVYGYRLMPGLVNAEGLFIAVLQKSETDPNNLNRIKTTAIKTNYFRNWITQPVANFHNAWVVTNDIKIALVEKLANAVYIKSYGPQVLSQNQQPLPALAYLPDFNMDAWPHLCLDYINSLRYLQGHTRFDNNDIPDGFVLVKYKGLTEVPLGFAKKTNNRFNNLLPKSSYIKMQIDKLNLSEPLLFPFEPIAIH